MKTVDVVLNNGLCCNCGTCAGICPSGAIGLEINEKKGFYEPQIDEFKCTNCGKCYDFCPGEGVNFSTLNIDTFNKQPDDILVGNYRSCYIGYAANDYVRYNSASGGVVTALLIYALENGIINGAIVTRMKMDRPFEPEPFIARTKEEILDAARSKYCPVPVNMIIKEVLESENGSKFAYVGLPCHIQGIRKAEKHIQALKEKIVIHLGIFCSHTDTFRQTKLLLNKLGIAIRDVDKIDYRGMGWPGKMSILLKNKKTIALPYKDAIFFHTLWINPLPRCLLCCDLTSELADISFGDPWISELMDNDQLGKSLIITRSESGQVFFLNAIKAEYVEAKAIEIDLVKRSGAMMVSKKKDIKAKFLIHKFMRGHIPAYTVSLLEPNIINYARAVFVYFNMILSSNRQSNSIHPLLKIELFIVSMLKKF